MMQQSTHEIYTLQSNASLDLYPDNKPGNFTVQIPQPFEFQGKWEVGLAEIHFPLGLGISDALKSTPLDLLTSPDYTDDLAFTAIWHRALPLWKTTEDYNY